MRNVLLLFTFLYCLPIIVHAQRANQKYVEVCGVKWAIGNLVYKDGNYQIQEKQYYCCNYRGTQKEDYLDHFNFGVLNGTVYSNDFFYNSKIKTICGNPKLDICTNKLGSDYRLPTKKEFETLKKKANQYIAKYYFHNSEGKLVYIEGIYFTTPEGKKRDKFSWNFLKNKEITVTDEDLEKGLFLPLLNYRQQGGHHLIAVQTEYKDEILVSDHGYYWSGDMRDGYGYILSLSEVGIDITFPGTGSLSEYIGAGMSIRPVYCGE